jgi:glycosyltransferase involved in cell wall biosynthesis
MKVIFINNYSMDWAWEKWKKKEYPGHHLWGATHLNKEGIDVDILPHEKYAILKQVSSKIKVLGDLDQQLRILLRTPPYDRVYSGCQYNTFFLSILRSIGLFKKPIVALVHHPMKSVLKNKLIFKILYGGHDKLVCLGCQVKKQLEDEFDVPPEKLDLLEWGVDLPFYDIEENQTLRDEPSFIVSAGKTYRDHDTLVKAFLNQNYSLRLYCTEESAPTISELSPNIKVQYNHQTNNAISYTDLIAEYKRAYAVAIPLNDTNNLAGLTSLLDAMAMAKAVIMTRNRNLDIDIEKEGVGIWVEQGDVKGWQNAISYLFEHPSETKEMGKRGRHLCETKYNLEVFSSNLGKILKDGVEK